MSKCLIQYTRQPSPIVTLFNATYVYTILNQKVSWQSIKCKQEILSMKPLMQPRLNILITFIISNFRSTYTINTDVIKKIYTNLIHNVRNISSVIRYLILLSLQKMTSVNLEHEAPPATSDEYHNSNCTNLSWQNIYIYVSDRKVNKIRRTAVREICAQHHGSSIGGTPETLQTSLHHGIERFKGQP